MRILQPFIQFIDDATPVTNIVTYADADLNGQCVAIRFCFGEREVFVSVNGDDDSIETSSTPPEVLEDASVRPIPNPVDWNVDGARGIMNAWAMVNANGRTDGLQIEVGTTILLPSSVVQLLAVASTLKIWIRV